MSNMFQFGIITVIIMIPLIAVLSLLLKISWNSILTDKTKMLVWLSKVQASIHFVQ